MPTPITMPQLAETTTEGTIGRWLKNPGDQVKRYDPLVEIMTDKVNVEMTSPLSGVLVEIVAPEGETIPVGGLIAQIAEDATATAGPGGLAPVPGGGTPRLDGPSDAAERNGSRQRTATNGYEGTEGALAPEAPTHAPPAGGAVATHPVPDGPAPPGIPEAGVYAVTEAPDAETRHVDASERHRLRLTPVVARLAEQYQIDVTRLTGTGIDGRVTKQDVLNYLETRAHEPQQTQTDVPLFGEGEPDGGRAVQRDQPEPASPGSATLPAEPAPAGTDADEQITITPLRRAIAENMVRSKTTAPHAWAMTEVDVTNLVRLREAHKESFRLREGVDLTYLPFFLNVVAEALRDHPALNASWAGDRIILKKRINIGIAVNRDDGLIVPVIKDAGRLSLTGLAHAVSDIVNRARSNTLRPDDVSGGTFTLNNTGALGVTLSYPIMVPGQAAILTTEAIVKRPVVIDDAIAIRSMMNMAIAFDHRITDGGVVGSFLRTIRSRLESLTPDTATL